MIKKFSFPKIKIWFEPMFFSEFFCGFERCGSAAFPNFRGGNFPEKCVRTNSRILHQAGKVNKSVVAERSEANQNSLTFPFWCSQEGLNFRPFALAPLDFTYIARCRD